MAGPIRIAVLANAAQARREIGSLETRAQRMGKGVQIAGRVAALGLLAAGAAAVKAGQAAAVDEAAQSKLAQTLRTAANATKGQISQTEKYIASAGKAYGVTDDELRPALGRLAAATGSVSKAQSLANLAMDVSTGTGKSLETVTSALAKAQNGSLAGLSKLGVATKDASGKTLTLTEITQQLANKYNGAASKAATTTAGKQKILTVQMGELQEKIGSGLLPVMNKLTTAGLNTVDWISKNEGKAKALAIAVGSIAGAIILANVAMKAYSAGMILINGTMAIFRGIQTAATIAQIAFNVALTANPIGLIVVAVIALAAGLILAYQKSETFRAIVQGAFEKVKAAADAVLGFVKKKWPLILGILTGPFGLAVLLIAKNWDKIKTGATAVKTFVTNKFKALGDALGPIAATIKTTLMAPFNAVKSVIQKIIDLIKKIKIPKLPSVDLNPFNRVSAGRAISIANPSATGVVVVQNSARVESRTYNLNVQVAAGGSPYEAGRAMVAAITAYEDVAGRRLTA